MTTNIIIDPVTEDIVVYLNEGVADGVTLNGVQTVTNKTFPSPKITGALLDTNGNELLKVTATASAVNELTLANAATAGAPSLTASGDDTNIDINLVPKGTGKVEVNGVPLLSSITTNKLTGRTTAGTGAVEEISVGSGLTLTSGTLSSTGAASLNAVTAATTSATIANGNNPIKWNWTQTTAAQTGFEIGETTASTSGAGSQILYSIKTLAASTADPLQVQTRGVDTLRISRLGAVTINALGGGVGSGSTGSDVTINGGDGAGVGAGGSVLITGGQSGVTSGNGGNITLDAGASATAIGGNIVLLPGSGTTPGMVKMGASSLNVGYLEIPQNSKSTAYTLVLTDSGKHILHPSADTTARTFTIPANASVAYPVGTAITFVNQNAAGVVTIAITTDTMRLAGAGTTGSRTLAANGIATAVKLTATEWIISGTGLT